MEQSAPKPVIELSKAQINLLKVSSLLEIFNSLEKKEIIKITEKVHFITCKKGDVIFKKGDSGKQIFYILKGAIHLYNDANANINSSESFILTLDKGHALGEIASITGETRTATAISDDDTILLSFQIVEDINPKIGFLFIKLYKNVIKILSTKLSIANKK